MTEHSFTEIPYEPPSNPCYPSPCGVNAVCKERNGAASCTCAPEFFGDPHAGCRPECVMNSDCPRTQACANNKCFDPCPGTCGINAQCLVSNHAPSCRCVDGYIGNPLRACNPPRKKKFYFQAFYCQKNTFPIPGFDYYSISFFLTNGKLLS
jgi:hypothetical protein